MVYNNVTIRKSAFAAITCFRRSAGPDHSERTQNNDIVDDSISRGAQGK